MKTVFALLVTALLASVGQADRHDECACQYETDDQVYNPATEACCGLFGGTVVDNPNVAYPGKYCRTAVDQIGGDEFYTCCTQKGGRDSACV